jgi:hypothetical protein
MKTMSAREAKNGFGLMIDTARAEPLLIEKHGRGVVVVGECQGSCRSYFVIDLLYSRPPAPASWG